MFFFNKMKNRKKIEWYLSDEMKPNLKNYKDLSNEDKINALKNLLYNEKISVQKIDLIINSKNPFECTFKMYQNCKLNTNLTLLENYLKNSIITMKLVIIENNKIDVILSHIFYAMVNSLCLSCGYEYSRKPSFSESTYNYALDKLLNGETIIDENVMTGFQIAFLKSKKGLDNFIQDLNNYLNNYIPSYCSFFIAKIGGRDYFKGLIYKNIENSLTCKKAYDFKKFINTKNINTKESININNTFFSNNDNENQLNLKSSIDNFKEDFNKIFDLINESINLIRNKKINIPLSNLLLLNANNYYVEYLPYTETGRKTKYPLVINFIYNISDTESINGKISYRDKAERYDITILCLSEQREIIATKENNSIIIKEIKEKNIYKDAFPKVVYKKN